MSARTNVMLTFASMESTFERTVHLNERLAELGHSALEDVSLFAGGEKVFTQPLLIGAFAHTSPQEIAEIVASCKWSYPQFVQLFCLYDDEETWQLMEVFK